MFISNIITGLSNKKNETVINTILKNNGYNSLTFEDGNSLIRTARTRNTDLIIIDEDIKGLRAIDIINIIYTEKISPVILITNQYNNYIDWIEKGWIFNYLSFPVDNYEFLKSLKSAIVNGQKLLESEKEILKLKKIIADRKTIEKAKGIIMEKRNCTEDDAYKYLRKLSMDKGISIDNISKAVISKFG